MASGMAPKAAREQAIDIVNTVLDAAQTSEREQTHTDRMRFVVDVAAHVLREPTPEAGRDAVRVVIAMIDEAEKSIASKP